MDYEMLGRSTDDGLGTNPERSRGQSTTCAGSHLLVLWGRMCSQSQVPPGGWPLRCFVVGCLWLALFLFILWYMQGIGFSALLNTTVHSLSASMADALPVA